MSIKLMSRVWESDLPAEQKYILLKLADYADDDGARVYPSVATVARLTGVSERTVQRQLSAMRESGLLEVLEKATQHTPTHYLIRGDKLSPLPKPGVTPVTLRGDTRDDPGVTLVSPEPPVLEPLENLTSAATNARAREGLAFKLYEQTIGPLDARNAQMVQEALDEGWSEECQTHCFAEASDHNKRSWKYVDAIRKRHKAEGCYAPRRASPERNGRANANGRSLVLEPGQAQKAIDEMRARNQSRAVG